MMNTKADCLMAYTVYKLRHSTLEFKQIFQCSALDYLLQLQRSSGLLCIGLAIARQWPLKPLLFSVTIPDHFQSAAALEYPLQRLVLVSSSRASDFPVDSLTVPTIQLLICMYLIPDPI